MLLPSALSCDSSHQSPPPPAPRLQAALFFSPPASPPTMSPQTTFGNIMTTCRSLQSLISAPIIAPSTPTPSLRQLPTPPLSHAPPPLKLRLRSRPGKADHAGDDGLLARRKIIKRAPPKGINKRRRAADDDMGRSDDEYPDGDMAHTHYSASQASPSQLFEAQSEDQHQPSAPSTPKRSRIAPEQLPLGLERSDYHNVHVLQGGDARDAQKLGTDVDIEVDGEEWSAEDDRVLVELVLEKLKLTKTEWQDCARGLGKDRHSVSRRWKSLIMNGDIGLKTRSSSRRAKLHSTWR